MAKDPAFLFYPGDWISGTMHLTFEEKGAYMELLMLQFNRSHMDIHMVKHMLGHKFEQIWPRIQDKFEDSGGKIWNDRLKIEIEKRKSYSESRRKNLKSIKKNDTHMSSHMKQHMENENENENKDKNKKRGAGEKKESGWKDLNHPVKELINAEFKRITALSEPTPQQCEDMLTEYGKEALFEVLEAMENHKDLSKKYTNFNLTAKNWLKRRKPENAKINGKQQFTQQTGASGFGNTQAGTMEDLVEQSREYLRKYRESIGLGHS